MTTVLVATDADWVFDRPGTYMSDLAMRLCRQAGFEPRIVCRFNNYFVTLRHIETQHSVALLPSLCVARGSAVVTRALTTPLDRNISVATRRSSAGRTSVQAVAEALHAVAAAT